MANHTKSASCTRMVCSLAIVYLGQATAFVPHYQARPLVRRMTSLHLKNPLAGTGKQKVSSEKASSGILEDLFTPKSQQKQQEMGDLSQYMLSQQKKQVSETGTPLALVGVGVVGATAAAAASGLDLSAVVPCIQHFFSDPTSTLEAVVASVESMGPNGALYFGAVYALAEVLAIPAFPLTASAGYLFGTVQGTAVVLTSASVAAAVSFVIGRTILRSYVEGLLEDYPEFKKIDKAIGKEGFKLMLLLRLSPIFPFALSNYLYGASSVGFWPYFFGTMIGFTPGTIAYVYSGQVGKVLTLGGDGAEAQPWYIYAGGLAVLTVLLKVIADVATGIIEDMDAD